MKTPKEYTDSLKKGILTKNMLGDCLYSINKRAKNHRDKERSYRNGHCLYNYEDDYREKKEKCYRQKETILRLFEPSCIHKETHTRRTRIYEYDEEFDKYYFSNNYIYENSYYDKETHQVIQFVDVMLPYDSYYLFYDFGKYSFHSPINEECLNQYSSLEIRDIGVLVTYGKDIHELLSCQFIKKVIDMIDKKEYQIVVE